MNVPIFAQQEVLDYQQKGIISASKYFCPVIHPLHQLNCRPYCEVAVDKWQKNDPVLLECELNVFEGFDKMRSVKLPWGGADAQPYLVRYKKYGEKTGRVKLPKYIDDQIVTPPLIGVDKQDVPLFINWPMTGTEPLVYQQSLDYVQNLKMALFAISVRSLIIP